MSFYVSGDGYNPQREESWDQSCDGLASRIEGRRLFEDENKVPDLKWWDLTEDQRVGFVKRATSGDPA